MIKSQTLLGACSQSPRLTLFFAAITLTCSAAVAAGGQPSPFQKTPAKWQLSGGNVSLSTKLTNYTNERSVFVLQALIFGLEGFQLLVCGGWVTRTHNRNTNTLRDTGHGGFWKKKKIQKIINHVVSVPSLLQWDARNTMKSVKYGEKVHKEWYLHRKHRGTFAVVHAHNFSFTCVLAAVPEGGVSLHNKQRG